MTTNTTRQRRRKKLRLCSIARLLQEVGDVAFEVRRHVSATSWPHSGEPYARLVDPTITAELLADLRAALSDLIDDAEFFEQAMKDRETRAGLTPEQLWAHTEERRQRDYVADCKQRAEFEAERRLARAKIRAMPPQASRPHPVRGVERGEVAQPSSK